MKLKFTVVFIFALLIANTVRKKLFWYTWSDNFKLSNGDLVWFCKFDERQFPFVLDGKSIHDVFKNSMEIARREYAYPELDSDDFFLYSGNKIYFHPIVGGNSMMISGVVYSIPDGV